MCDQRQSVKSPPLKLMSTEKKESQAIQLYRGISFTVESHAMVNLGKTEEIFWHVALFPLGEDAASNHELTEAKPWQMGQ